MMRLRHCCLILLWSLASTVYASLYVEITGGQASGIPIAVVPFAVEGIEKSEGEAFAKVIKADLENSGQFKGTSFQEMKQFPSQRMAVRYQDWNFLSIENLVIGHIRKTGTGRFKVTFELLDMIRQSAEGMPAASLLSMQFDNIQPQDFRALSHHISNLIFEKLMGIKGIFSTRIAYIAVTENSKEKIHTLEVADYDGFNPKPLVRSLYPLMSPAWSPDGKKIAFVSFEKDRASINVVDVLTGKVSRVTQFPGINGAPAWSPDNRSLALVLSKEGTPKIYTVDLHSKQLMRITDGMSIDTEPCFAPDGRSIVFTSNRGGKAQIYRVTLATGKIDRLTFAGDYNATPSLTPDGRRLVMLHKGDDGLFGIAVQTLSSGELRVLTRASLSDSPSLAPNGMMVLYGLEERERGVLGAVSLDGRVKIRLPSREGNVQDPAWSPFAS